ncbi:MAG: transporter substrate-binding domain-containing protein [Pseudomonadota bacterium]
MVRHMITALLLGMTPAWAQVGGEVIVIGIRAEARPFAWYEAQTRTFRGYLTDLCYEAVRHANYLPRGVPITAKQRDAFLAGDPTGNTPVPDIDLLCDPTTISMGRITTFLEREETRNFRFSPIVFLANGTLSMRSDVDRESMEDRDVDLTGWTCTDPETEGAATLLAGFVVGTTAEDEVRVLRRNPARILEEPDQPDRICSFEFENHAEGISKLCNGEIDVYFGDSDIVDAYAALHPDCKPVPKLKSVSYEPYALVVTDRTEGFYDHFVKGLYASFGNSVKAQNRVLTYFPDQQISEYLETLYRIYQIP